MFTKKVIKEISKQKLWCKFIGDSQSRSRKISYAKHEQILEFEAIPTARRLPIFGTTLDLIVAGSAKRLHEYIDARHHELGPIFREKLGPMECVFVSSPELMRETFLYEGKYPRHPLPEAWLLYGQESQYKRGLFFMDGEEWLQHRKIMNSILLNREFVWTQKPIEYACDNLIHKWQSLIESSTHLNSYTTINNLEIDLYKWSIETVINLTLGTKYCNKGNDLKKLIDDFANEVHKIFKCSAEMFIIPPKLLKLLNSKTWIQFEKVVTDTLELASIITDKCLDEIKPTDGILHEMLKTNMPRENIKRIFVDLIIAAGDTTAFATLWALYLLSRDDSVQNNIRKELQQKIIDNDPKELSIIKGVIKESLRLYPIATFVGRFLETDAIIGNYKINKDTLVLLSFFTSGRDEANFRHPNDFCPLRWVRSSVHSNNTIKPQATMPFAMGSRSCVGQKIANKQMHCLISKLLSNFHLIHLDGEEIEPILRMVLVPEKPVNLGIRKID